MTIDTTQVAATVARAVLFDKASIGKLATLVEDHRPQAASVREVVWKQVADRPSAPVLGITGSPGVGKSSLIGQLVAELRSQHKENGKDVGKDNDQQLRVGIIAVDPSSQISGGSFLGDRTRVPLPEEDTSTFFRSQPSNLQLGGVGLHTFYLVRLFRKLFDIVLVETVGVGQGETAVRQLADVLYLVLQPLGGDHIQFLKAGIMETPDVVVVNKCDQEASQQTFHAVKSSLGLANQIRSADEVAIFQASAATGVGITELAKHMLDHTASDFKAAEYYFLRHWIGVEYGRCGSEQIPEEVLANMLSAHSFEDVQKQIRQRWRPFASTGENSLH